MKETTLWEHLKPELKRLGKFQKISDRFTPGVPDVIGCLNGIPYALELKEFRGVNLLRVKFRPGQVDWLKDWVNSGGVGLVISSCGTDKVWGFDPQVSHFLEEGVLPSWVAEHSLIKFLKTRNTTWGEFVKQLGSIRNE